jgi:hypothetical protein
MAFWNGAWDGIRAAATFPRLLDRRGWKLFFLYIFMAGLAVSAFALIALWLKPSLKQAIVDYIFPSDWQLVPRLLMEKFFGRLGSQVMANFILTGGMALLAMLCAPIKEMLSRSIERSRALLPEPMRPWPVWRQVVEEIKFALLYLLVYNAIFWMGYPPIPALRSAATVLSYVALFVFFDITFLCPLFLRHRIGYPRMIRIFLARPVQSFTFAALWCAPAIAAGLLLQGEKLGLVLAVILAAHVLVVAPAASAGTELAARLMPAASAMRPAPLVARLIGWLAILAALGISAGLTARLANSLHKKTQVLKCEYQLDPGSLSVDWPSLSDPTLGLSVDLQIRNPTRVDLEIENSRLEITNDGRPLGIVRIGSISVPAGQTRVQRLTLRLEVSFSRLLEIRSLLSKKWDFVLWLKISEDFEFPLYFR